MRNEFDSTPRLVKTAKPAVPPSVEPVAAPLKKKRYYKHRDLKAPGQAPKGVFPYWSVWNRHHAWMPMFRHPSEDSASTEALRLAGANKGRKYYVVRVDGFRVVEPSSIPVSDSAPPPIA